MMATPMPLSSPQYYDDTTLITDIAPLFARGPISALTHPETQFNSGMASTVIQWLGPTVWKVTGLRSAPQDG